MSGNRILVVDDDLELCQVIIDTLKEHGYDAFFVQTAEEAYQKVMSDRPDLILLDLEIPQMGGFVLCQKLRSTAKTRDVPVIFLTVRDSDFDKRTAISLGANRYITKPFRRSYLLKEVESLLAEKVEMEDWIGPSPGHAQKSGNIPAQPASTVPEPPSKPPHHPVYTPPPEPVTRPAPAPSSVLHPDVFVPSPTPPRAESVPVKPQVPDSIHIRPHETAPTPSNVPPLQMMRRAEDTAAKTSDIEKAKGFKTYDSFKNLGVSISKKVWDRILQHKTIALGITFVIVMGLMWGSVTVYRKIVQKKALQVPGEVGVIAVNVMQASLAPFQDILSAVGTITGGSEIELRFQTEGNLRALNFKEGAVVRAGQVIAQLDQTQTMIKLERARSEFFRYEKLYALGGVSKDRLEEARVQYDYAQSELDKTVLRASQDGILGDKGVEVGEFITPQKKVGTLVSLKTVLVRIGIIEKEIDKVFPGQKVLTIVDTYPGVEFQGKVENISPLVQGQSKTLTVEARIPNEGKLLLPGMFARAKIIIFEKDNVIAVPNDALEKTPQGGYQLYVVGKENKAEVRQIEVNYVSLTHSLISNGLQPGEQVIVQKPQELKPGSPLKVVEVEKSFSETTVGAGENGVQ